MARTSSAKTYSVYRHQETKESEQEESEAACDKSVWFRQIRPTNGKEQKLRNKRGKKVK